MRGDCRSKHGCSGDGHMSLPRPLDSLFRDRRCVGKIWYRTPSELDPQDQLSGTRGSFT